MEKIKKNKKNHPQLITYDTMTQTKVRYRGKRQIEKKKRISLPITRARNTKYSGKNVRMQKVTSGESILFHMMRLPMKNVRNAKFTISASTIEKFLNGSYIMKSFPPYSRLRMISFPPQPLMLHSVSSWIPGESPQVLICAPLTASIDNASNINRK